MQQYKNNSTRSIYDCSRFGELIRLFVNCRVHHQVITISNTPQLVSRWLHLVLLRFWGIRLPA